jgi:hypothetical protein
MSIKVVLFAFRGEIMCFAHVLLNALDLHALHHEVKIVLEGEATKLVKIFHDEGDKAPFAQLWKNVKDRMLIDAVCKACATKMGSIKEAELEELPILGDMSGHPPMRKYLEAGFQIITF